jgi:hypothetical protein
MDTEKPRTQNEPEASGSDYLWDGSGEPDPEIQKLEVLLAKFRHDRPAPEFPEVTGNARRKILPRWLGLFPSLVAAAAAVAIVGVLIHFVPGKKPTPAMVAGWDVSRVEGTPRIGAEAVNGNEGIRRFDVGQMLETDGHSRVNLKSKDTGQIEVDPSTRLRLLTMNAGLKRVALDRGTIHAYIWGPPGQFVVDTPSAMTVDLGCAYTLHVDDSGAGLVRTSLGWVGFKLNGRESFIPAGAACATRPKVGPGTPYFEDAPPDFRSALARFDFEDSTSQQREADLAIVLGKARKRDALTLWHLLARVDESQRALIFEHLTKLAPPPAGITRDGILRLDQPMLDQWWNELGFDDISVWRYWERNWSGASAPVREK